MPKPLDLDNLPERHREIIRLYKDGLIFSEIGQRVGCSGPCASMVITRLRKAGVDVGPRRPPSGHDRLLGVPGGARNPLYMKLTHKRFGYTREQAIAAVLAAGAR